MQHVGDRPASTLRTEQPHDPFITSPGYPKICWIHDDVGGVVSDLLNEIQETQFTDRRAAEGLLLNFVRSVFPLDAISVELRPLVVSLNSFNGFVNLRNGERLFFKTHVEPDTVISEYYSAGTLERAGYPVLKPLYSSTEAGRQLLMYPVVDDPSVFDVARQIEDGDPSLLPALTEAQQSADRELYEIYCRTLAEQTADEDAFAAIHQLFSHRLTGARMRSFYGHDPAIALPRTPMRLSKMRRLRWTINGRRYSQSLDDLIETASAVLLPGQPGPSIIGHGDAHNGNVFLRREKPTLFYFDPAFAGRHDPLLDLAKPLFHNSFARWMYLPEAVAADLQIEARVGEDEIHVEHDFQLTPIRKMFLTSKVTSTLTPTLIHLALKGWLRPDWRWRLKAALMCCPLLTMNLTDGERFPPEISLLGLTNVVEMGGESLGARSVIDALLDETQDALRLAVASGRVRI
jgi:phosphotransferase family enzyme